MTATTSLPAPVIGFLFSSLSTHFDDIVPNVYSGYGSISVIFLLTTLALYLLLGIVAPVQFTLRLTGSVGLAGILQGIITTFFADHFLCIIFCDAIDNLPLAVPVVMWPVLFCVAMVFGSQESIRRRIPDNPS